MVFSIELVFDGSSKSSSPKAISKTSSALRPNRDSLHGVTKKDALVVMYPSFEGLMPLPGYPSNTGSETTSDSRGSEVVHVIVPGVLNQHQVPPSYETPINAPSHQTPQYRCKPKPTPTPVLDLFPSLSVPQQPQHSFRALEGSKQPDFGTGHSAGNDLPFPYPADTPWYLRDFYRSPADIEKYDRQIEQRRRGRAVESTRPRNFETVLYDSGSRNRNRVKFYDPRNAR